MSGTSRADVSAYPRSGNLESVPAGAETDALCRAAFELAPAGMVLLDPGGRVLHANRAVGAMLGFEPRDLTGRPMQDLIDPQDHRAALDILRDPRPGADAREAMDVRFVRRDGAPLWTSLATSLLRDGSDRPTSFVCVVHDISSRKRVEDDLRLYRLTVDSVVDYAIFRLDASGRIASWNAGAERIKGYRAEEIIGQHFSCFYLSEDIERGYPEHELEVAAKEGRFEDEGWRIRADGRRFWANVVITALRDEDGTLLGYTKVTRDLSDRRRAEEALRESEQRLQAILDYSPAVVYLKDTRGRHILVNRAFENLFGVTRERVLGRTDYDFLPGHVADTLRHNDRAVLESGIPQELEEVVPGDDGERTYLSVKFPLLDSAGAPYALCGISTDITERKRVDERVRALNAELESRVIARTKQLTELNAELEAFSYSVSHDLRAPLRSIDGFSQVLLEDYDDRLDPEGKDYLRRIRAATGRMGQLIDGLLGLSRVTRTELTRQTVDLSAIARSAIAQLQRAQPEHRADVGVADGLVAFGDPLLLRVVIENLLENAWKFSRGEPTPVIEFGVTRVDDGPAYYVRDNGAGFDTAYADKLFGAFQRLHSASEFEGTGIGLATVHRIIRRHGGRIWAEGTVGQGATFSFTLGGERE